MIKGYLKQNITEFPDEKWIHPLLSNFDKIQVIPFILLTHSLNTYIK